MPPLGGEPQWVHWLQVIIGVCLWGTSSHMENPGGRAVITPNMQVPGVHTFSRPWGRWQPGGAVRSPLCPVLCQSCVTRDTWGPPPSVLLHLHSYEQGSTECNPEVLSQPLQEEEVSAWISQMWRRSRLAETPVGRILRQSPRSLHHFPTHMSLEIRWTRTAGH